MRVGACELTAAAGIGKSPVLLRVRGVEVKRGTAEELTRLRSCLTQHEIARWFYLSLIHAVAIGCLQARRWGSKCSFPVTAFSCFGRRLCFPVNSTNQWHGVLGGEQRFVPPRWTASRCRRLRPWGLILVLSLGQPKRSPAGNVMLLGIAAPKLNLRREAFPCIWSFPNEKHPIFLGHLTPPRQQQTCFLIDQQRGSGLRMLGG